MDALIRIFGADHHHGTHRLLIKILISQQADHSLCRYQLEVLSIEANGLFVTFLFKILTSTVICNRRCHDSNFACYFVIIRICYLLEIS